MNSTHDAEDRLRTGRRLLRAGHFAEAADIFREFAEQNPDHAIAYEALGTACFAAGDYTEAVEAFTRVSQLKPGLPGPLVNLGAVYNRTGEFKKALDILRKALQRDRNSGEAYYNMGLAHRGLNQLSMAVTAYREAVRLSPEMAEAYQNLANSYYAMGNYPQAVTHYRRAVELRPGFERAKRGLQRAEEAMNSQKHTNNSMQRFGQTMPPPPKDFDDADVGPLSEEQIRRLYQGGFRSEDAARRLADFLAEELEEAVLSLNRAVTHKSNSPLVIEEYLEEFRQTLSRFEPLRQELQKQTDLMRTALQDDEAK